VLCRMIPNERSVETESSILHRVEGRKLSGDADGPLILIQEGGGSSVSLVSVPRHGTIRHERSACAENIEAKANMTESQEKCDKTAPGT
jgi:hypothetical protein